MNSLSLQAKLLRVLEDGTLRRVGSVKERRVGVRLLAATNRDLLEEVKQKRCQLQNTIDRTNILADDDRVCVENLPPEIVNSAQARPRLTSDDVDLDTLTRDHVLETYRRHANNKAQTVRAPGIGRRTRYRLSEKYSIGAMETAGQLTRES